MVGTYGVWATRWGGLVRLLETGLTEVQKAFTVQQTLSVVWLIPLVLAARLHVRQVLLPSLCAK